MCQVILHGILPKCIYEKVLVSAFTQQDSTCVIIGVEASLESFVRPWMRNPCLLMSLHLGENASMADRVGHPAQTMCGQ